MATYMIIEIPGWASFAFLRSKRESQIAWPKGCFKKSELRTEEPAVFLAYDLLLWPLRHPLNGNRRC